MNHKALAKSIFMDALEGSLPKNFMHKNCFLDGDILHLAQNNYALREHKNLYVFGSGKAAYSMAKEIESILGERIYKGLVITPYDEGELQTIEVHLGSHPVPTQKSLDAAKALVSMMQECDEDDLYIFLLSGGSSALMELPIEPITLEDLQATTKLMLSNNLDIHEINTIRKHLSNIKGGRLANLCKATGAVLLISDIIDNDLESIASGSLYADKTTFLGAKSILDKKGLFDKLPLNVQSVLERGIVGTLEESPFVPLQRVKHQILASNAEALYIAQESAKAKSLRVKKVNEPMDGEVYFLIKKMLTIIENSEENCILFGGECTVTLNGDGKGGRNQHAALLMLKEIHDKKLNITFLSAGTDGVDGNSDATGAVVDIDSYLKELDIDEYINNFDSNSYFNKSHSTIVTGPSGTNVIDIAIIIKGE